MSLRFLAASTRYLTAATPVVSGTPLSMAAWVNPDNVTGDFGVISVGIEGDAFSFHCLELFGSTAGDPVRAASRGSSGGVVAATTSSGFSAGAWQHVAGVWSASNARAAYLNGGSKGTNTSSATPGTFDVTKIGIRPNSVTIPMSGLIANAAVWNVALTDAEILMLAQGALPFDIRPANLVAYWPIVGNNSPERNIGKTSGLDMTWTNSPTKDVHAPVRTRPTIYLLPGVAAAGGTTPVHRDMSVEWNVRAEVSEDASIQWNVREEATVDAAMQWNVRAEVSEDAPVQWHVYTEVNRDASSQWHVYSAISRDAQIVWNTNAEVFRNAQLSWHTRGELFRDASTQWNIRAEVNRDATVQWHTYAEVARSAPLAWNVIAEVFRNASVEWHVREQVHRDAQSLWNIRSELFRDAPLEWHVASNLTSVFRDASMLWNVLAAVQTDASLLWNVRAEVSHDAQVAWNVYTSISRDALLDWNIRSAVSKDASLAWHINAGVYRDATLRWNVLVLVGPGFHDPTWVASPPALLHDTLSFVHKLGHTFVSLDGSDELNPIEIHLVVYVPTTPDTYDSLDGVPVASLLSTVYTDNPEPYMVLGCTDAKKIALIVRNDAGVLQTIAGQNSTLTDGWHLIGLSFNGTTASVLVDTVAEATTSNITGTFALLDSVWSGGVNIDGNIRHLFDEKIGPIYVFSQPLSNGERTQLYQYVQQTYPVP